MDLHTRISTDAPTYHLFSDLIILWLSLALFGLFLSPSHPYYLCFCIALQNDRDVMRSTERF